MIFLQIWSQFGTFKHKILHLLGFIFFWYDKFYIFILFTNAQNRKVMCDCARIKKVLRIKFSAPEVYIPMLHTPTSRATAQVTHLKVQYMRKMYFLNIFYEVLKFDQFNFVCMCDGDNSYCRGTLIIVIVEVCWWHCG